MAYNFIGLVNNVNRKVNEVELTTNDFATATGFYSAAKDSINTAIRQINQVAFEWPFNHVSQEDTLTAGTVRYSLPSNTKAVDYDTFRIKRDNILGNETRKLQIIMYEEYLERYVDAEYDTATTSIRQFPQYVFRTPNQQYGVYPAPDKAYTLVYEYYSLPTDLSSSTDVPTIPEQFQHIIVDGAMYYTYTFRGNTQDATLHQQKFEEGIKNMRTIYINRYDYIRDTRTARIIPSNKRIW
jgi:hypothetical protein